MTKYSIVLIKWNILYKGRIEKVCKHQKTVIIMDNSVYI